MPFLASLWFDVCALVRWAQTEANSLTLLIVLPNSIVEKGAPLFCVCAEEIYIVYCVVVVVVVIVWR